MRVRRAGLAALLAAFAYVFSIAAAPLLSTGSFTTAPAQTQGGVGVGVAYAATASASSQCAGYSGNKDDCATGYTLQGSAPSGQTAQQACAPQPSGTQAACIYGFNLAANNSQAGNGVTVDPDGSTGINVNQCDASAGDLGWITCPIFDRITHFMSGAAKDLMQQFLAVQPLSLNGPLYQTWNGIRSLANVMFVIIFLVLIFAHVLQFEIDAYAIKTMIPKIVAAVVLVQFSYVICSALVDVGNIAGAGIGSIISSVTNGGNVQAQGLSGIVDSLISLLTSGLAVTALVALAVVNWALAGSLFMILIIAAIGFIVTLAVRYFLIGLLIVTSPIAFALWVLPNTEAYFGKWLSTFTKLIMMYPIIMLLLSVAGDIGGLLPTASASGSGAAGTVTTTIGTTVIQVLAAAAAFAAVPQTFRWAGGAMALAANGISKATHAGVSGKWNSSGTQVKRAIAKGKRLETANKIDRGIHGEEGGFGWAAKIGHNRVFGESLQGLHGPLTNLIAAGTPSDRTERQHLLSSMVDDQSKSLGTFASAGSPDNLLNVARWYYSGQRAQQTTGAEREGHLTKQRGFEQALRAADAFNLTDYTRSDVRREALFKQMAEKDYLKLPLLDDVHQAATGGGDVGRNALRDHAAIMRQGVNKHGGTEPMVYKRRSDSEALDRIRRDDVLSTVRGLNARAIQSTFSGRNFEVGAGLNTNDVTSRDAAEIFAEGLDAEALRQNFETGNQNFMAADKRSAVMRMMLKHRDLFADGTHGGQIRSEVVGQMMSDIRRDPTKAHLQVREEMRDALVTDANERGVDAQQALADAQDWINASDGGGGFTWPT
jgi:hypothetical protein